jgi:hypothetical protein
MLAHASPASLNCGCDIAFASLTRVCTETYGIRFLVVRCAAACTRNAFFNILPGCEHVNGRPTGRARQSTVLCNQMLFFAEMRPAVPRRVVVF